MITIIHGGPTTGKTTLMRAYPDRFLDPEDVPGFKTHPRYVELRAKKPWRKNYDGWEADKDELNLLYAAFTRMAHRPGQIVVSNMANSDAWCNAIGGTRVASFFRKGEDICSLSRQRGGEIPLEYCNMWYTGWKAQTMTCPKIELALGKYISDYVTNDDEGLDFDKDGSHDNDGYCYIPD